MLYRLGIIGGICLLLACDNQQQTGLIETAIATPVAADACSYYYHSRLKKNVYTKVEVEAAYPGGSGAMQRFMNKNLRYPTDGIDTDELQTSVYTTCIVDTDGQITDIKIKRKSETSAHSPLDKEFIRIIKLMPKWQPASCDGKPVASEISHIQIGCIKLEVEE